MLSRAHMRRKLQKFTRNTVSQFHRIFRHWIPNAVYQYVHAAPADGAWYDNCGTTLADGARTFAAEERPINPMKFFMHISGISGTKTLGVSWQWDGHQRNKTEPLRDGYAGACCGIEGIP